MAKNKKFLRFKKPDGWELKKPSKGAKLAPNPKIASKLGEKNVVFSDDRHVWAKGVMHPGFEARHFLRKIFNDPVLWKAFQDNVMINYKRYIK